MEGHFSQYLADRKAKGQLRRLHSVAPAKPGHLLRDGRTLVDFSSNDYLGLSQHPLLIERAAEWARNLGTGARASRLVTGTLEAHCQIERKIAAMKGTETALLFASGWQANATIFPALVQAAPGAAIFTDRLVHASIHHGIAASGKRQHRFRHNDCDHLQELLEKHGQDAEARLIVTESVFSMDGDRADLQRLSQIAQDHDAFLIVDEAHATGVLGAQGAGLTAAMPVKPDLVMGTFSKALGSFGAFVCGSQNLCDFLTNAASGFVYSTALPPPVLGAIDAALDLFPTMEEERAHLTALAQHLRAGLNNLGIDYGASDTQIVPAIIGAEDKTLALAERLDQAGLLVSAIRPPTVPAGSSRLRIALSAAHDMAQIDTLLGALESRK